MANRTIGKILVSLVIEIGAAFTCDLFYLLGFASDLLCSHHLGATNRLSSSTHSIGRLVLEWIFFSFITFCYRLLVYSDP